MNDIYEPAKLTSVNEWTVLDEMDFDGAFHGRWISFPRAVGIIAPQ